jgi:hypothetical protein
MGTQGGNFQLSHHHLRRCSTGARSFLWKRMVNTVMRSFRTSVLSSFTKSKLFVECLAYLCTID